MANKFDAKKLEVMELMVYAPKEGEYVPTKFRVPSFVLDGEKFRGMAQAEHVASSLQAARDKYDTACERLDKADNKTAEERAKIAKACTDAEQELRRLEIATDKVFPVDEATKSRFPNVDEIDTMTALYCVAFGLEKGRVSIESYKDIHHLAEEYISHYYGASDWTDGRKCLFSEIKTAVNEYLEGVFNGGEDVAEGEDPLYKPIKLEINSKYTTMYLDKAAPTLKRAKVKDKAGDVVGIAEQVGTDRTCFSFLLMYVFFKYGCEVKVVKNTKKKARWAF